MYNHTMAASGNPKVALLLVLLSWQCLSAQLAKFSVSSYILPDKKLEMQLDITVPRLPDSYPVILMVTGLQGVCPSYFQSTLIDSIAEQGYAYVSVSKLQSPNPQKVSQALRSVIDWMNENLQLVFNNRIPGVVADMERFILMGHSAGGHVVTEYLNATCGTVKLQILLDPVDGADPFGFKKDFIVTPGKFLPYATPVLILTNELDHARKDRVEAPCAPEALSNDRFYNAMSGPKWMVNVTKYGHIDFFNNEYRDLATLACATCRKDCNFAQYRTLVKQAILSFIDAVLYKDPISLEVIQGAKFAIPSTFKHNYMGYDPLRGGYCLRKNAQTDAAVGTQPSDSNLVAS